MKTTHRLLFHLAASVVLLAALCASAAPEPKSRTFRFTYRAVVREIPSGARSLDVWIPYPQTDPHQVIQQVKVSAPGSVTIAREPRLGNEALYYHVDRPSGPVELAMEVTATRWENLGEKETLTPEEARGYLGP